MGRSIQRNLILLWQQRNEHELAHAREPAQRLAAVALRPQRDDADNHKNRRITRGDFCIQYFKKGEAENPPTEADWASGLRV